MISVIIPTYQPNITRLKQALDGLKQQTIAPAEWELIIIDNNSPESFAEKIDLTWHSRAIIVKEPNQGLTHARLKGFAAANGTIIVMVDDDNVLHQDYLANVLQIFSNNDRLGAIGGRSIPLFEAEQPAWLPEFYQNLALRDLGTEPITAGWNNAYPVCAPIGAGMAIRKAALKPYLDKAGSGQNLTADRTGSALSSGGDNEIVLELLRSGWLVAYFPQLRLQHIIPANRMDAKYIARLVHDTNCSWIQLLAKHGINPWSKIPGYTLALRKIKAYFRHRAWKSNVHYIRWRAACGTFNGLAAIK